MGFAVAVLAIGADLAGMRDLRMQALRVGISRIGMATHAEDFLRRCLVREALHVFVAIDASQLHRAVDRVLKLFAIDEEGNLLAVDVFGKRRVAMAGEAVFVFQFVLGTNGEGRAQQKESERTEQDSAGNFHGYEETPECVWIAVTGVTRCRETSHSFVACEFSNAGSRQFYDPRLSSKQGIGRSKGISAVHPQGQR